MDNSIQKFMFQQWPVDVVKIDDQPWWVGKQVADILGYKDTDKAIRAHVDEEDKLTRQFSGSGQKRNMKIINESGLYSLILGSKLPRAKEFKHWVTSEVLPAIRKHGAYMTNEKAFNVVHNKEGLADLLEQAANQLKEKDIQIEQMKPKALFADAVATSKSTILIGQLAKMMRQNGINIGQNRLFAWMRRHGYLGNRGSNYNVPTQY